MAKVSTQNEGFNGRRHGVTFHNGVAHTDDQRALEYFEGKDGFSVEDSDDNEAVLSLHKNAHWQQDAAVNPDAVGDRKPIPRENVGRVDPHSQELWNPGIHTAFPGADVQAGAIEGHFTPGPANLDEPTVAEPDAFAIVTEDGETKAVDVTEQEQRKVEKARRGGDDDVEEDSDDDGPPSTNANKRAWVNYAKRQGDDEAALKTKQELVEQYGKSEPEDGDE